MKMRREKHKNKKCITKEKGRTDEKIKSPQNIFKIINDQNMGRKSIVKKRKRIKKIFILKGMNIFFFNKLLNFLVKNGKKHKVKKLLIRAFLKLQLIFKKNFPRY